VVVAVEMHFCLCSLSHRQGSWSLVMIPVASTLFFKKVTVYPIKFLLLKAQKHVQRANNLQEKYRNVVYKLNKYALGLFLMQ